MMCLSVHSRTLAAAIRGRLFSRMWAIAVAMSESSRGESASLTVRSLATALTP
jgi:hypothetical protein